MDIVVRKARIEDLVAINGLTDAMHNYLASLYGLELSKKELEEEHFGEEELENTYVAENVEEGIVGYMCFSKGRDEWTGLRYEIEHIVVREDLRGLGIGRKLFEILLQRATREGVNITTGTLTRDKGALRFYKKLGFKPFSIGLLLDLQRRALIKSSPTRSTAPK